MPKVTTNDDQSGKQCLRPDRIHVRELYQDGQYCKIHHEIRQMKRDELSILSQVISGSPEHQELVGEESEGHAGPSPGTSAMAPLLVVDEVNEHVLPQFFPGEKRCEVFKGRGSDPPVWPLFGPQLRRKRQIFIQHHFTHGRALRR